VVRWEPAAFAGQEVADPDAIPGYGVDAGTGCFACADRAGALDTEADGEALLDRVLNTGVPTWSAVGHPSAPEAVVVFSSGWGDGFYGSWWGLDDGGEPVVLITDFDVLTLPVFETFVIDAPSRGSVSHPLLDRMGGALWRPWLGALRLVHRGPRTPRVRVLSGSDATVVVPSSSNYIQDATFPLGALPPDARVEIAYIVGQRAAKCL
ncbi:MAG: DUF4241 domain-containing protein, partial [Myxococcales bacterium]|nr:DUF4241 domain-containing protein [Myxococcales bacterium]